MEERINELEKILKQEKSRTFWNWAYIAHLEKELKELTFNKTIK